MAPAEKEKLVHQHFDTVSARYDFMNTLLSFGMHYPWKWTAVRLLGLKAGDRVLDVCGGTADLALLAARRIGPAGRVVVYDINRAMMAAGRPKVAKAGLASRIAYSPGGRRAPLLSGRQLRRRHGGLRHPQPDPSRAGLSRRCTGS